MTDEPGTAELRIHRNTGVVTVLHADPVIRVAVHLLERTGSPWWDGETLVLDTAAQYRYRYVRPDRDDPKRIWVFERTNGVRLTTEPPPRDPREA